MFRIKKLDIFIAKQFGLLFAGTFFISLFVLMMQFLWQYVEDLVGKGLSMTVMAQFFGYMGLMLVPQALPLAVLLSSLITYGNLGEQSDHGHKSIGHLAAPVLPLTYLHNIPRDPRLALFSEQRGALSTYAPLPTACFDAPEKP